MKVKSLRGREYYWRPKLINWNGESKSKFQKKCKVILANFWGTDIVAEEQNVPGTKMAFDFVNFSKKIIVECNGGQHYKYNRFFHNKNIFNYVGSQQRDQKKKEWAEFNKFIFIEVKTPEELNRSLFEIQ